MPNEKQTAKLHPDLERCRDGANIRHPLICQPDFGANEIEAINSDYEFIKQNVEEARQQKGWESYLSYHERPFRFQALCEIEAHLTDEEYGRFFAEIWTECEEVWQNFAAIRTLLDKRRPRPQFVMTVGELAEYEGLPPVITVYRGFSHDNHDGLSWTTSEERAVWFARKDADETHQPRVVCGTCAKEHVVACFLRRSEREVFIEPERVRKKETRKL
jgi:hypothetical protein